jgi:cytochrome c556
MKRLSSALVAAVLSTSVVLLPSIAVAKEAANERQAANAVQFRQALLQLVRSNLGPLGGMARGRVPYDVEVMKTNGERLEQLALMLPDYFETDTRGFSVESDALPKLWDNKDDFLSKANDLTIAAKALQVAAETGDETKYRAAIGKVSSTCKACHDSYKKD